MKAVKTAKKKSSTCEWDFWNSEYDSPAEQYAMVPGWQGAGVTQQETIIFHAPPPTFLRVMIGTSKGDFTYLLESPSQVPGILCCLPELPKASTKTSLQITPFTPCSRSHQTILPTEARLRCAPLISP